MHSKSRFKHALVNEKDKYDYIKNQNQRGTEEYMIYTNTKQIQNKEEKSRGFTLKFNTEP